MSGFIALADKSIEETVTAFLECPYGFHGDTGLQHYLYHRLLTNNANVLKRASAAAPGRSALLVQSEHYTRMKYRKTGMGIGKGRFDVALISPDFVEMIDEFPSTIGREALVAFEVGRNKGKGKLLGDIDASPDGYPKPGDFGKLFREIKHAGLRIGYCLSTYDPGYSLSSIRDGDTRPRTSSPR